jgi:hypothetical protein
MAVRMSASAGGAALHKRPVPHARLAPPMRRRPAPPLHKRPPSHHAAPKTGSPAVLHKVPTIAFGPWPMLVFVPQGSNGGYDTIGTVARAGDKGAKQAAKTANNVVKAVTAPIRAASWLASHWWIILLALAALVVLAVVMRR